MNNENDIRKNGSGYVDPTAYKAIKRVSKYETNFSEQLKYIMRHDFLSKTEVANMSGFDYETITKYVNGEEIPSIRDAEIILESLGYSLLIDKLINERYYAMTDEDRFKKLLKTIYSLCELSDFHVEDRIVLRDMRTGQIWR